jgi:murein DD-endopeptidase / murein LD-carboxypeptidase
MTPDYAERARALVGTRFRPQGRADNALDCIGLVVRAFELDARTIRKNYRLRGDHRYELEQGLLVQFRRIAMRQLRPGDVMLLRAADDQVHLGVRTNNGFVHAHAGIGYVVETPGMPEWPVLGVYRRRARALVS